jgi:uncharacterized protein
LLIAVLSDIHDNIWRLAETLPLLPPAGAVLCCGDLCSPFTLLELAGGFPGPVHVVWGNNDGDRALMTRKAPPNVTLHGEMADLVLGGKHLAMVHYPPVAGHLAGCGDFEAVFYGHSHQASREFKGECLLLNPGELMGRFGRSTFATYETETGEVAFVELPAKGP